MKRIASFHVKKYLNDEGKDHLLIAYRVEAKEFESYFHYRDFCTTGGTLAHVTEEEWGAYTA